MAKLQTEDELGYVQFKIKTQTTITANDVVSNTAYIYFDLNSAVVTNTVNTGFHNPLNIITPSAENNITVKAFPNPFSDYTNIEISGLPLTVSGTNGTY